MVAPHGSYEPIFGTNPLAIGIPTIEGEPTLILDMATSAEAWFGLVSGSFCFVKYNFYSRNLFLKVTAKEQGLPIRPDVAFNNRGQLTTSPADALEGALQVFDRLYPFECSGN